MAHYAYVNENNIVFDVIVGPDESEIPEGYESWEQYFGEKNNCLVVRTSYNTMGGVHYALDDEGVRAPSSDQSKAFRKNYAGIDFTYDAERDAFIPPKPFESWILNQDTCLWQSPIPYPEDGKFYNWDEESGSWVEITE